MSKMDLDKLRLSRAMQTVKKIPAMVGGKEEVIFHQPLAPL